MLKFIFMGLVLLMMVWWGLNNNFFSLMVLVMFLMYMCSMKAFGGGFTSMGMLMGQDLISYGLIMLSIWICCLMMLISSSIYKFKFYGKFFTFLVLMMMILLVFTFSVMNFFLFYLFFESSLIPILLMILGWGYQPERLGAGIYMLFYTLLASLPLLMGIFYLGDWFGSVYFYMMGSSDLWSFLIYYSLLMAFFVKLPLFGVHIWLPKAHVEAPVGGSMILAGVLLKLGGYGVIRVFWVIYKLNLLNNLIFILISLVGGLIVSLICFRQTDLKCLVAYSSVVHMGLMLGGMLTLTIWGFSGGYILMIAHGLCSSGLFVLVNIMYERYGSRNMLLSSGALSFLPSMSMWWFLFCVFNMAAPPSINLLGEISLINSVLSWSVYMFLVLMFISFFSGGYCLYLYSYSQHGKFYSGLYGFSSVNMSEYFVLFFHFLPLNLFILNVDIIYDLFF
uniref:NADH-ubiquinone oxidoreductase chain 4 n=1 Tax=Speleketor irwini TaxID=342007 RepID=A0A343QCI2_9NEOP|nr:NADH dehydrogenase subunit 4 [Speleketor irwini]ATU07129.1 NADH dehydrogenase subunit 4 [Speleketor irwini]